MADPIFIPLPLSGEGRVGGTDHPLPQPLPEGRGDFLADPIFIPLPPSGGGRVGGPITPSPNPSLEGGGL